MAGTGRVPVPRDLMDLDQYRARLVLVAAALAC